MRVSLPHRLRESCIALLSFSLLFGGVSCSSERFLPEGKTVLSAVKVTSADKRVKASSYRSYVRQEPNSRWFSLVKVPLGIYCISGKDSTRRINRFFRKIGEAPVVYEPRLTDYSQKALTSALKGQGYIHAEVDADTAGSKGLHTHVHYTLRPGNRYHVSDIAYRFDSRRMEQEVMNDTSASLLHKGMPVDASVLSAERSRIIRNLQNRGYYALHKEFVSFRADTLPDETGVKLTVQVACPPGVEPQRAYSPFRMRNVRVYEDVVPGEMADTVCYKGLDILYRKKLRLYRRVYNNYVSVRADSLYREQAVRNTYSGLNGLSSVSYTSLRFSEVSDSAGGAMPLLDCDVLVQCGKPHSVSAELEGTNTAGDLGAAVALTYSNRNIFRGAESLSLKLRGAYEAITGLEGYSDANYMEYSAEGNIRFPLFLFPFITREQKMRMRASTDLSLQYDSQDRPEFHRRVLTAAWTYAWQSHGKPYLRHRWDLISLNYVFMPWISDTFRENYLEGDDPRYSILRYSYENLFIMKTGYGIVLRSKNMGGSEQLQNTNGYQLRMGIEAAGNLLYGFSRLISARKNKDGQYSLFNIAYSQYAKFDIDFSKNFLLNERNSLAMHCAFGIAVPYGNSSIVPYEKRYFSGGANSVRGWSVRELGPGGYKGEDGKIDFINQTGNLKLDLSLEYRARLFWKFHGAAFIDAGNIWNTRNYAAQPDAQFKLGKFYKQIAVSYGLGLRLNFDYFILRFDGGMKAIDPTEPHGKLHYPVFHPDFSRDFTFHFAVGLPF